jgi:hypothetical protein
MKPVHLQGFGAGIGYAELARIRHTLTRALADAKRNHEPVSADLEATVQMVDELGSGWEKSRKKVPGVSQKVSLLDGPSLHAVEWVSMKHTSELLDITPQAVGRLLKRGTIRGEKTGGTWRIDAATVSARKERKV